MSSDFIAYKLDGSAGYIASFIIEAQNETVWWHIKITWHWMKFVKQFI